jgi:alpha-amylase
MTSVVFYFQVHQPNRLRSFSRDDVGTGKSYFDKGLDELVIRRVAERCYLPMNALLARVIEKTNGRFSCAFSISGAALSQMEAWTPEVVDSFVALARTGSVEFLCETSHHSLAALVDAREFELQVRAHKKRIADLFGRAPTTFRNTELVFDNGIAQRLEAMGFDVLLGEGADQLLGWRSPQRLYRPRGCKRLVLLLRRYEFSDDIAFRFSNTEWDGYPLLAETFASKLHAEPEDSSHIGLFMDYETFGEHQSKDTGIFDFMESLPERVLSDARFDFATPSEVARRHAPGGTLDVVRPVSWADAERDLSAWLGNLMQRKAHAELYALADDVRRAAREGSPEIYSDWQKLTTSDHVYYMATKWFANDSSVHEYFSHHESPYAAYTNFCNVLDDLKQRVERALAPSKKEKSLGA